MKPMTLEDIKKVSLDIMIYLDKICRENDIEYAIYYGTLLGAVRHKGFIPWDDDIDIVVPRPDYDRLLKILQQESKYLLLSFETRSDYRYPFAKLVDTNTQFISNVFHWAEDKDLGVFVDIFPLDGMPSDKEVRTAYADYCELLRLNMMDTLGSSYARAKSKYKSVIKRVVKYPHHRKLLKQGDYSYWRDLYMKETVKYPFEEAETCGYMEFINYPRGLFPIEWFHSYKDIEFEGHYFRTIQEDEAFLKMCYGDYMQLPPENERVSHHTYDTFWK